MSTTYRYFSPIHELKISLHALQYYVLQVQYLYLLYYFHVRQQNIDLSLMHRIGIIRIPTGTS